MQELKMKIRMERGFSLIVNVLLMFFKDYQRSNLSIQIVILNTSP